MLNYLAILIGLVSPDLTGAIAVEAAYALQATPVVTKTCCGQCKGGIITHGDGHKTKCPCPDDCKCKAVTPAVFKCEGDACRSKK